MKDLLVVVPSRGRPQNIGRLADAMAATCRGDTTLIVGLDDDDPTAGQYPDGPAYEVRAGLRNVVPWINELAVPQVGNFRWIGHIGDDNVPLTDGWDVAIMEALEATPFAFGNDLYPRAPGSLCCHVFTRSDVIGRLGYFGPPSIRHMYVDVAWMAWGVKTGITYLHDVILEHRHFTTGAPHDDVYATSQALIPSDLERWHDYCNSGQLNADIARIDPAAPVFDAVEMRAFNQGLFIPPHWGATW